MREPPALPLLRLACQGKVTEWNDGPVRIGRAPDNQVVADDASLSRHHVEINLTRHGWVLRDLDSANGVWRDGTRLPNLVLHTGDEVLLGKCAVAVLEARTAKPGSLRTVLIIALLLAVAAVWFAAHRDSKATTGLPHVVEAKIPEVPTGFGAAQSAAWLQAALAPDATGADLAYGRLALVWRSQGGALSDAERRAWDEIEQRLEARLRTASAAYLRAAHVHDRGAADAALRELHEAFPQADPRHARVLALQREAP